MRIGRFKQAAQDMAAELLAIEGHIAGEEAERTSLSVKVNVSTSAMLGVLADQFGQSRYAFGGEILDDFIRDLFLSLPEDRQVAIAEKADALTTELLTKQGVTVESSGPAGYIQGDQTWRMFAANVRMWRSDAEDSASSNKHEVA